MGGAVEFVKRKHPRLKGFDYSQNGCYFITICTKNNRALLSHAERSQATGDKPASADTAIRLTVTGRIVEQELLALPNRYPCARIDKYVMMPTHLHVIIRLEGDTAGACTAAAGASPRPTLMDIIRTLKSLTTRAYNQSNHSSGQKIWQTSFYEKVIRNERMYAEIWEYIESNPLK